jgi:hypothetical protein
MRNFKALALSAAFAAVASASDVEVLTKDTFPEFVKGNDLVLAECKYYLQAPIASGHFCRKHILTLK